MAKEKETKMQLDQEKVNAKLFNVISENKFRSSTDKHYSKYEILSNTDSIVCVIDREDSYKIYSIPYLATETADGIVVNIDYDNKTEKSLGVIDKITNEFNIQQEIEMISNDTSSYNVNIERSIAVASLNEKLENLNDEYDLAKKEINRLTEQLGIFQKEKELFMAQKHKESIDTLIASKRDEMGNYSKFLDYCIEPDYSKTIEQVENDLKEIRYEFLDSTSKSKHSKSSFSVIETKVVDTSDDDIIAKLYGADVAKYFNK